MTSPRDPRLPSTGEMPSTWFDPRETPMPRGVIAIATASAHAHAGSRSHLVRLPGSKDGTTIHTGTSRATAVAQATARIAMVPGQVPSARNEELTVRPVPLSSDRQARLDALMVLNRPFDWRDAVAELGRVYLRHPELIEVELTQDVPQIDAARIHELLGRATMATTGTQRADELVTLAVLMLADDRLEAARGMISRIVPESDAERDSVQSLARSLQARIKTGPSSRKRP